MEDPENSVYNTINGALTLLYKGGNVNKPSAYVRKIREVIKKATDAENAYTLFANELLGQHRILGMIDANFETTFVASCKQEAAKRKKENEERKKELEQFHTTTTSDTPVKKVTGEDVKIKKRKYSAGEKEQVKKKLENDNVKNKLFEASERGYTQHREKSRTKEMQTLVKYDGLPKSGYLTTGQLAVYQEEYIRKMVGGSALTLEKGSLPKKKAEKEEKEKEKEEKALETETSYHVTMTRRGGQEINQLGPYLGPTDSVESIQKQLLKETKLKPYQLAIAVQISSPEELLVYLEKCGVKDIGGYYFGKIRALRVLMAVEKDRGFEVSAMTSMEMRSSAFGYSHVMDYPTKTPLGPPNATKDIRGARKEHQAKRVKLEPKETPEKTIETVGETVEAPKEGKKEKESKPMEYSYIPDYIQTRSMNSLTSFVTSYMETPKNDPTSEKLIFALLSEPEDKGPASDTLVDVMEEMVSTPMFDPFGLDIEDEKMGEDEKKGETKGEMPLGFNFEGEEK